MPQQDCEHLPVETKDLWVSYNTNIGCNCENFAGHVQFENNLLNRLTNLNAYQSDTKPKLVAKILEDNNGDCCAWVKKISHQH